MSRPRADTLDYPRLVRELFPRLTGGIRWGLERTERILERAGNPERRYPVLHIAGTNGKGTVAAVAESILRAAGLRTGLYTSPHLTSFRERIRIDAHPVDENTLVACARRLWSDIEIEQPSFFEATTAIAFEVFAQAGVEVAIVEVGLGGRLDATNVVRPDVAVVTQVAIDHVEFLGSDPAGIAREKAGIGKADVPLLVGETDPVLLDVILRHAREAGALPHVLPADVPEILSHGAEGGRFRIDTAAWGWIEALLPLRGRHQPRNAALAIRAIELSSLVDRVSTDAVVRGVTTTRWGARLQRERVGGRDWLFDVAHNPSAMERLADALRELAPERPLTVLLGVMVDKDWRAMLGTLAPLADRLILTRPEHAPADRAWDPALAAAAIGEVEVVPSLADAVAALRPGSRGTVLVTGSFHTVGEAMIALGVDPGWPPDPYVDAGLQRSETGV